MSGGYKEFGVLGYNFFFHLCSETLDTAATNGLLCQPRMIGEGDC
jgi:hypothetical protein